MTLGGRVLKSKKSVKKNQFGSAHEVVIFKPASHLQAVELTSEICDAFRGTGTAQRKHRSVKTTALIVHLLNFVWTVLRPKCAMALEHFSKPHVILLLHCFMKQPSRRFGHARALESTLPDVHAKQDRFKHTEVAFS